VGDRRLKIYDRRDNLPSASQLWSS
jgi:hypothetical protein